MTGYEDFGYEGWSVAGWRTHLPGVADVRAFAASLGEETIPAAVAGAADERWGERVTAWVVLRGGYEFDEAALIAHARTRLAGYKCPKRIFQLAELPRNQLGKVVRSGLRERG